MLFLRHIIALFLSKRCSMKGSVINSMRKKKPLQVRVDQWILHRKTRASCFASSRGSVTVEASLAFPLFLCAFVCIIVMAQMILIDMSVYHAASQTAKVYARQQAVKYISEGKSESSKGSNVGGIFFSLYDGGSLCGTMVEGGERGIKVSAFVSPGEEVYLKAEYHLKMPIPFFRGIRISRRTTVKRRIFSGYVKHWGEYETSDDNSIVYVAEYGVMHSAKYNACEKCIHGEGMPGTLFVTAYGDCYHSTLGCSGLKRTIRAVKLSEVRGMRPCSRCGGGK